MLMDLSTLVRTHSLHIDGVLHLGCHLAEEAQAYHRGRCGKVWWVEADPVLVGLADVRLARFPDQRVIEACVAEVDGDERTFHRANNGQSSSLYELGTHLDVAPDVRYVSEFTVTTRTVDSLVAEHGIRANFINADLQGGELSAFKGGLGFLSGVDYIYSEVNWEALYVDSPLLPEVDAWLAQVGFTRYDTMMAGNSGWGDALWARPEALGL